MKINNCYGKEYVFVDVRSPKEFEEDHIPDAINIPLLNNEERAIVGTIYKKESKEKAINKGVEFLSPKLPDMINQYKKLKQPIIIYCFRGGMRSNSIASLLKSLNFEVEVLKDGYKSYREFVREQLTKVTIPNPYILYGLTGSGKTEILNQINNSLDLEGLAQHRGSVFGDIGLNPRSQKYFESLLLKRLLELKDEKIVFIEGESRKIGKTQIPEHIWKQMQQAKKVKIVNTMEERVSRIKEEYKEGLNKEIVMEKLNRIEKYIGKEQIQKIETLLDQNKMEKVIQILLEKYYDKLYAHTVNSKTYEFEVKNKEELLERLS